MTSDLIYERRGSSAWITFNRPHRRNAMTFAMYDELMRLCIDLQSDDGVRVAILRGAGAAAFVAGTDIDELKAIRTGADGVAYENRMEDVISHLECLTKPTIALIQGHAVGGGLALAAACDLRVCTPDARFGLPIARTVGNCLSMQGYARLASLLGPARAKDMIFTARALGAEEALTAGFVSEVVAPDAIEAHVEALATRVATHAPLTLRVTKEALRRLRPVPADGHDLIESVYGSRDFARAVEAFATKEAVIWQGN